ncbi:MAG TPA: hypothetical protein VJT49_23220 [Amycolatopsis sp.]|uniref:hypothetical protein n=1 Tax=Amycolatopsis sp. TaxID=37632 RepID=UPI002B486E4C|nr:hypothetical protein [Amycolatopsis sp.]HKS47968.1 hypothetical protein [Amycolatopsis sp.]
MKKVIGTSLATAVVVGFAVLASGTPTSAVAVPTANLGATTVDNQLGEDDDTAVEAAQKPKEGEVVKGHRRILLVTYYTAKDCVVHPNYPTNPGKPSWTIQEGAKIIWRYNVTSKVAAISDPARDGFPHWGFVEDSTCIGKSTGQDPHNYTVTENGKEVVKKTPPYPAGVPMPQRILSGRSQYAPFWRQVDWRPDHGAEPTKRHTMTHNATLRDAPHRFVIGNVYNTWEVRPTSKTQDGYTEVYVPSLGRWGWLQL